MNYIKTTLVIVAGVFAVAAAGACAIGTTVAPTLSAPTETIVPFSPPSSPTPAPPNNSTGSSFTLSESDLNRQIAQGIPAGDISNPRVDIHPNNLADFSATIRNGNLSLSPNVSIQLQAQNGRIVIDVLKVEVGGFGVPPSLIEPQIAEIKRTAEAELNRQLAEVQASSGLTLRALSTTEDSLTLYFGQ